MTNKSKEQIKEIEKLKSQTIAKIYGLDLQKEIDYRKFFKPFMISLLIVIFLALAGTTAYLSNEYKKFQDYIASTNEDVRLANEYKHVLEEEKIKAEQEKLKKEEDLKREKEEEARKIQELKDLNLDTIINLPDTKKILMLNILPSGKPIKKTIKITSPYGYRIHPITKDKKFHHGVDIKLNIGDDVIATSTGIVSFAGTQKGYGKTVVIKNIYGFETMYAHLSKLYVKSGEIVGKGKIIAAGGNSGFSTGPHLHYEIRYKGKPIDPQNFMNWNIKNFDIIFRKEKNVPWDYFLTIMGKN